MWVTRDNKWVVVSNNIRLASSNALDFKQIIRFYGILQFLGDLRIHKLLHYKRKIGKIPITKEYICYNKFIIHVYVTMFMYVLMVHLTIGWDKINIIC